jgi:hypothetical protein
LAQEVEGFVPLSVSTANPPPSAWAFEGFVWKPLLSPACVTGAFVLGLRKPVFVGGWEVGVGVTVVEVAVGEGPGGVRVGLGVGVAVPAGVVEVAVGVAVGVLGMVETW